MGGVWGGWMVAGVGISGDSEAQRQAGALGRTGVQFARSGRAKYDRVRGEPATQCYVQRMAGRPLHLRLPESTVERLGVRAQRMQLSPRGLAQRYVEEGLRADEHPLVRFVDGPAGRRARLVGTGCDVWEVVAAVRDNDGDVAGTAIFLELPLGVVQAAVAYCDAYPDEIDGWISRNEQEATEAHAAWLAGQAAAGSRDARGVRRARGDGRAVVERMRGRAATRMSTDEIMRLTRGED